MISMAATFTDIAHLFRLPFPLTSTAYPRAIRDRISAGPWSVIMALVPAVLMFHHVLVYLGLFLRLTTFL